MTRRWRPGDRVVLREVWRGRVWTGRPVTVVRDTPELVALHMPPGAVWKAARTPQGEPKRLPGGDWILGDAVRYGSALRLSQPGAAHSVEALFKENDDFVCWYINLEEAQRRTPIGFDYMDQTLDIVVYPDLSGWWWKDEDEFAVAQARGIYSPEEAAAIRQEGEKALERLLRREPPLDEAWEEWRPDPGWPVPQLPEGWDALG